MGVLASFRLPWEPWKVPAPGMMPSLGLMGCVCRKSLRWQGSRCGDSREQVRVAWGARLR